MIRHLRHIWQWYRNPFRRRANWAEIAILCLTIAILLVYRGQLRVMGKQLEEIVRQYPELQKSAKAARDSADTAVKTMHIDDRAWIYVRTGQGLMVDGAPITVPIAIINEGKTAAFNLTGKIFVNVLHYNEEPEFEWRKGHPAYDVNVKAMTPNSPERANWAALPKHLDSSKPLRTVVATPLLRQQILDGRRYIVVHARLTYDDIFGIPHWVQFCGHIDTVIPGTKPQSPAPKTCGDYKTQTAIFRGVAALSHSHCAR